MKDSVVQKTAKGEDGGDSYRGILKSTSLIGGASFTNILIGMIRTKFVAILLGPSGVGLLGLYSQIIFLFSTASGLGISNSGVRQIAEAVGTGDSKRIASTVITLRRVVWLTGGIGMLVMAVFCVPFSRLTFGDNTHAIPVALLGIIVLLGSISVGQSCVLRGTRRIADISKITVIGAVSGVFVSIPCFYLWGIQGIVPSLILSSIVMLWTSWWYARRVSIATLSMPWRDSWQEAKGLLSLGLSFMGAGLVTGATGYAIQTLLVRQFGIADNGIYQAAFALSGVLAGFVLNAMAADYYPRLTAAAKDNLCVHRMVNEQAQISILLALPGLAAMMIFAPLIIKIFYTPSFTAAVPILRWCILGVLGRVFAWPLSYVLLAKGNGRLFFITEIIACGIHLAALFIFTNVYGVNGAGIAFMTLYVIYTVLMLIVIQRTVKITWNYQTVKLVLFSSLIMVILMINCSLDRHMYTQWIFSLILMISVSWYCLVNLLRNSKIDVGRLFSRSKNR